MFRKTLVSLALLFAFLIFSGNAIAKSHPKPKPTPIHRKVVHYPANYSAWTRVAICEEGGWTAASSWYPRYSGDSGGYTVLGINGANWLSYGRRVLGYTPSLPPRGPVSIPNRILAVEIGNLIEHGYVPDQSGCASW